MVDWFSGVDVAMIPSANDVHGSVEDFARFEFKYVLTKPVSDAVEAEIGHFMSYDGYVHPELGNRYFVRSLYFDNALATHYYEKIDGVMHRRKFRIRTYARQFESETPIYLEEKGRHIDRTFKSRVRLEHDDLPTLLMPSTVSLPRFAGDANEILDRFFFMRQRRSLAPAVLVDYVRRPYISFYDLNFRLTFDSSLAAVATNTLFPGPDVVWRNAVSGYTILEVKFHRRIPAWFHRIIKTYNLRRVSISKFCKGMEVCNLARDLS